MRKSDGRGTPPSPTPLGGAVTTVHEGSDHQVHVYLEVVHQDGRHEEIQLPDEEVG